MASSPGPVRSSQVKSNQGRKRNAYERSEIYILSFSLKNSREGYTLKEYALSGQIFENDEKMV
jgi:hypothetical protein